MQKPKSDHQKSEKWMISTCNNFNKIQVTLKDQNRKTWDLETEPYLTKVLSSYLWIFTTIIGQPHIRV